MFATDWTTENKRTKKTVATILLIAILAAVALSVSACGSRTSSYAFYEFICEGEMTVTALGKNTSPVALGDEDIDTLLGVWGHSWSAKKTALAVFDYEFQWENTTIRYCSARGIFRLEGTGLEMKADREDRETVERILENLP